MTGWYIFIKWFTSQVSRNPQMKNTTNLLILNLAVADLLFLLVCVPATASDYVLMYWPFGLAWCRCVPCFKDIRVLSHSRISKDTAL